MVRRELHHIDLDLGLFSANNKLIVENWREFKRTCCMTRTTMNVLLERPDEVFFKTVKQVKAKNKKAELISSRAREFFTLFMEKKNHFAKLTAIIYLQPYKILVNEHSAWPRLLWRIATLNEIKLRVIDFRRIPPVFEKDNLIV